MRIPETNSHSSKKGTLRKLEEEMRAVGRIDEAEWKWLMEVTRSSIKNDYDTLRHQAQSSELVTEKKTTEKS